MSHALHVIPDQKATAAENMAHDFLLLNRYRPSEAIRIRHYDWAKPSYTFGMSQQYSYVESEVQNPQIDLCRRPTGGGVVSHLEDWTYSLVIPSTHPIAQEQPTEIYRAIHQCIANAITAQNHEVELNLKEPIDSTPGVCFNKAEVFDVVLKNLPSKVAGAAQKRSKMGYLLQGSIWKPVLGTFEWNRFYNDFIFEVAKLTEASISYEPWPSWVISEFDTLVNQFESEDWNQRR